MKVLVVGDVMIDSYVWGKVNRISPEAPVPVVEAARRENRLGGAANVAQNLRALGATPILCSVIGNDAEGDILLRLMQETGMPTEGMVQHGHRITTVKHRIISGSQHLLRIDAEVTHPLLLQEREALVERVRALAPTADVIIFEDYDKGVLTPEVITEIVSIAKAHGIPTTVDPKKRNFLSYEGVSLFKPNLKELREGLNLESGADLLEEVRQGVSILKERMDVERVMVTLSEKGVFITDFVRQYHIPAHHREITDVSGAGDTVISVASLCLAVGMPIELVAGIANIAGGLVCEHVGVVPIERQRLMADTKRIYGEQTR